MVGTTIVVAGGSDHLKESNSPSNPISAKAIGMPDFDKSRRLAQVLLMTPFAIRGKVRA
jgi:hypothetical protein